MKYMQVSGNHRNPGLCSDNECPCGVPGATIPPGQGYIYISKEVVDFRMDSPSESDAQRKIERMSARMGSVIIAEPGVFSPILMCEQGARKRKLDLSVASADAKHWWATGDVPLRPTPLAGSKQQAAVQNDAVPLRSTPVAGAKPESANPKPGFWKRLFGA